MCARWETGETRAWVPRGALDVPLVAAFACAAMERETDPTVMATTAPAATILLVRTCCSPPCVSTAHPCERRDVLLGRASSAPAPSPHTVSFWGSCGVVRRLQSRGRPTVEHRAHIHVCRANLAKARRYPREGGTAVADQGDRAVDPRLDIRVPHIARVYDYWLNGKDNFSVDRVAAEQAIAAFPGIRESAQANRAFLRRTVSYLTAVESVRQFLDIGT